MIYSLRGEVILIQPGTVVVECSGVGYKCSITLNTFEKLPKKGETVVLTHMVVRDDTLDLFGFADVRELECFRLLISVNGVGPKAALALLSQHTPDSLSLAIASGDAKSLTLAQGVGSKLSQRIVLELKDKLSVIGQNDAQLQSVAAAMSDDNISQAAQALVSLGYSMSEAALALKGSPPDTPSDVLIRLALKAMSSRRQY